MKYTITIIGFLFVFFLSGYIVGLSRNYPARSYYSGVLKDKRIAKLENTIKHRDQSYKLGQCENLLLKTKLK